MSIFICFHVVFMMFFLQWAPTNCPRRKLPRRQLKPRRPRPRKVATDGWRRPSGKRLEMRGKLPWKSPLFHTNSGKISKNILRNCGTSWMFSLFFFSRCFNHHFLLHSVCWFAIGSKDEIVHAQGAQGLRNSESSIISGCTIHKSFTHYMNASLDPVGKLHLF